MKVTKSEIGPLVELLVRIKLWEFGVGCFIGT